MKQRGFTLIELLVVVVIIGILASVAIPNFMGAQDKAKNGAVQSNCHVVQTSIEAYRVDHGDQYPVNLSSVISNSLYVQANGFHRTPWGTQQASADPNIPIPTQAHRAVIGPGARVNPTLNTHYGAVCYVNGGTANDQYQLSGIGKQGDNAYHVFYMKNY